jgi:hypothetical protein
VPARGLDAATITRLTLRHGSSHAAAEKAKQDPRFAQEFRELERLQWMGIASGPWETAEDRNAAATAEWWRLVAAWDLLDAGTEDLLVENHSWPVPFQTFWKIFRLAVEEGASARRLAKETDENDKLEFVNRIKAGVLVAWVKENPEEARRRLRVAELPPGFSATQGGVVFPAA